MKDNDQDWYGGTVVIAFAGRRIDALETNPARFPLDQVPLVRSRLETLLRDSPAEAVVCSAACGADLLALDVAGQMGLRRLVVLPFTREQFRATSVVDRPGDWGKLYDRILDDVEHAGDLVVLGLPVGDRTAYTEVNRAMLKEATALSSEVMAAIVWEGKSRGPTDVTEHFKGEAEHMGYSVSEILTVP